MVQDSGYYGRDAGVDKLECEVCGSNQVPTRDGKFCISCPAGGASAKSISKAKITNIRG